MQSWLLRSAPPLCPLRALSIGSPAEGDPPTAWNSRCRSDRDHPLRCVQLPSRHTARMGIALPTAPMGARSAADPPPSQQQTY
eukprot:scaffold95059_cov34-Tisochrysis_lutea.AAC.3